MYKPLQKTAVQKFFTTESQEKSPTLFEKVHYPMDRVRVEFCKEGPHSEFAHESQIAHWVMDVDGSTWGNRIFSVVGETGSGKSELAQYLQYRAKASPQHVPILISRSTTRLAAIIRLLNEHAGLEEQDDFTELTELTEAHIVAQSVAKVMMVTTTNQFKNRYSSDQLRELERLFERPGFRALLARSFQEYKEQVEAQGKERELNLLNRREFDMFGELVPWLDLDEAYVACRDRIHEGVKELIQVGDMAGRLRRIAERYRKMKKRPLLIMEDLTSFGFMKEELLDYLFELPSGNFDVVMGWTTGFEAENLGSIFRAQGDSFTYMRERLRGRFVMTNSQRTSWFLETNHVPMMAKYVHAAREASGMDLPLADLYPVTPAFVTNLYNRLIDENRQPKKTPRLLLNAMSVILSGIDEPWMTAHSLVGQLILPLHLPGRLFDLESQFPDEVRFLEWFGRPGDGKVSRRDAERFGIKLPTALVDFLTDEVLDVLVVESENGTPAGQNQDHEVPEPSSDQLDKPEPKKLEPTPERKDEARSNPEVKPPPESKPDPLSTEKFDIQQWLGQGADFNNRRAAESGLDYLLSAYGDAHGLGNLRGQVNRVLRFEKQKVHAVFEGSSDRPGSFPVVFVPQDRRAHEHILKAITVRSSNQADAALIENPELVHWVGHLYDNYRTVQREYLSKRLGMSIEHFVYHVYVTVVGLTTGGPGQDLNVLLKFDPNKDQQFNGDPGAMRLTCLRNAPEVSELLRFRRTITNMFRSFFFTNPTTLDLTALERIRNGYSYERFGRAVGAINREAIDEGFWLRLDPAELKNREDKVSLNHLFIQCVALNGRLKAARQEFETDRKQMQEERLRSLGTGLTVDAFPGLLSRVEGLLSELKRAKDQEWSLLQQPGPVNFPQAIQRLEAVAARASTATDVFAMVGAWREYEQACKAPEVKVLRIIVRILSQLEKDVQQTEGELMDRQFDSRGNQAAAGCERQYQKLQSTLKEAVS